MQVIQIDIINAKTRQRFLTGLKYIFGFTVYLARAIRQTHIAKFTGQYDLVTNALKCLTYEFLVLAPSVHIGSIDHRDARIYRGSYGRDGFIGVGCCVDRRHTHTAQPQGRYHGSILT